MASRSLFTAWWSSWVCVCCTGKVIWLAPLAIQFPSHMGRAPQPLHKALFHCDELEPSEWIGFCFSESFLLFWNAFREDSEVMPFLPSFLPFIGTQFIEIWFIDIPLMCRLQVSGWRFRLSLLSANSLVVLQQPNPISEICQHMSCWHQICPSQ